MILFDLLEERMVNHQKLDSKWPISHQMTRTCFYSSSKLCFFSQSQRGKQVKKLCFFSQSQRGKQVKKHAHYFITETIGGSCRAGLQKLKFELNLTFKKVQGCKV